MTNTAITVSLSECFGKSTGQNKKPLSIFDQSQILECFKYPGLIFMINNAFLKENAASKNINFQGLKEFKKVKPIISTISFGEITNTNGFSFQPELIPSNELSRPLNSLTSHISRESSQSLKFNMISEHLNKLNGFTSNFNIITTPICPKKVEEQDIKRIPAASIIISKLQNQAEMQKMQEHNHKNDNDKVNSGQYKISIPP